MQKFSSIFISFFFVPKAKLQAFKLDFFSD